jgi:hypothetical protein
MTPPVVYIAGPYTSAPTENTRRAVGVALEMIVAGMAPICPHLSHFVELIAGPLPWVTWLDVDMAVIEKCDAVYRLEGSSRGADIEVRCALDHDIPVYYAAGGCTVAALAAELQQSRSGSAT